MRGLVLSLAAVLALTACGDGGQAAPDAGARCGDGVAGGDEACDGADLRGRTCAALGFNSGTLVCHPACVLDSRACATVELCANGQDDDGDGDKDCDDLECAVSPACSTCGDGVVGAGEQCDDRNDVAGDCCVACQAEAGCEIEPNAEPAAAQVVGLDAAGTATVGGAVGTSGDVDVFAVRVPAGSTGTLSAQTYPFGAGSCSPDVDSYLELIDDRGVIAADDDAGEGICSRLVVAGLAPGLAFVRVKASPFDPLLVFGYRLGLALSLAPCGDGIRQEGQECDDGNVQGGDGCSAACRLEPRDEVEPNDTSGTASSLPPPPFRVDGRSDAPQADNQDSDWFAFELTLPANLALEVLSDGDPDCLTLIVAATLRRDDGSLLVAAGPPAPGSGACATLLTADGLAGQVPPQLAAGRYRIKVASRPAGARYRLRVTYTSRCGDGRVDPPEACDGGAACDAGCRPR